MTRNDIYHDAFSDASGRYYLMQSWHGHIPALDKDIDYLEYTIGKKDLARNYLGYIEDAQEAIFQSIQFEIAPLPLLVQKSLSYFRVCDSRDYVSDEKKKSAEHAADYITHTQEIFAFIDPSAKGKDATAVCIGWYFGGRIIIYGKLFYEHWGLCFDKLVHLCGFCKIVYFEDNHGSALGSFLREKGIVAMGITTHANKVAKITSLRGLVLADRLRLSNVMDSDSIMQIKTWTETAEYDDLPDCMAMLVQKMGWVLSSFS